MKRKRNQKNKIALTLFALALLFFNCSTRPSHVLSDQQMEDILFDLYLSEAIKDDNYQVFNYDSIRVQELAQSVFKKHKVTEQQFDSSLVWYAANMEKYLKILDKISDRYTATTEEYKTQINALTLNADGTPIQAYLLDTAFILTSPGQLNHRFVFNLEDDSLSSINDFRIDFDVLGINQSTEARLHFHILTQDSTFRYDEAIVNNGRFQKDYLVPEGHTPYRIYGYIEFPDRLRNRLSFPAFRISRYNDKK